MEGRNQKAAALIKDGVSSKGVHLEEGAGAALLFSAAAAASEKELLSEEEVVATVDVDKVAAHLCLQACIQAGVEQAAAAAAVAVAFVAAAGSREERSRYCERLGESTIVVITSFPGVTPFPKRRRAESQPFRPAI